MMETYMLEMVSEKPLNTGVKWSIVGNKVNNAQPRQWICVRPCVELEFKCCEYIPHYKEGAAKEKR